MLSRWCHCRVGVVCDPIGTVVMSTVSDMLIGRCWWGFLFDCGNSSLVDYFLDDFGNRNYRSYKCEENEGEDSCTGCVETYLLLLWQDLMSLVMEGEIGYLLRDWL